MRTCRRFWLSLSLKVIKIQHTSFLFEKLTILIWKQRLLKWNQMFLGGFPTLHIKQQSLRLIHIAATAREMTVPDPYRTRNLNGQIRVSQEIPDSTPPNCTCTMVEGEQQLSSQSRPNEDRSSYPLLYKLSLEQNDSRSLVYYFSLNIISKENMLFALYYFVLSRLCVALEANPWVGTPESMFERNIPTMRTRSNLGRQYNL